MSTLSLLAVPALTLHRPWSHLVARCGKDVESRTWDPGRISRLLIHAGKRWDQAADVHRWLFNPSEVATSAIVAAAAIDRICSVTVNASPDRRCDCGPWAAHGQYHWRLRDVQALPEPVPARGRQRLWYPDRGIHTAVEEQIRTAAS